MKKLKMQVLKKKAGWYWRLVASNGKILSHSETYSKKQNAFKTANQVVKSKIILDKSTTSKTI